MDLGQVTLTQLRYATAVADARSFRAAASACHVSQSGLSMQVRKLEESLGVVLFDRSKKPVLVTPEGEAAIAQMRAILRETERLGRVVAEEDEPSGRFRLGVIPTLSPTVLPLFLGDFVARYPRVDLVIEELKTEAIITELGRDTLDAGLVSTPLHAPGLTEHPLAREPMLAYLPPADPLLARASVSQRALRGRPLWVMPEGHCFRTQVLEYCGADQGPAPAGVRFESGSFETLIRLVDRGLGATILPALATHGIPPARRKAQLRPLTAPVPVREIGLVTARTELRRKVTAALVSLVRERLEAALEESPRRALVLDPLAR